MEQVVGRFGDGEPGYRITQGGIAQLWRLVDTDRLEEAERVSLCLVLSEVESRAATASAAARRRQAGRAPALGSGVAPAGALRPVRSGAGDLARVDDQVVGVAGRLREEPVARDQGEAGATGRGVDPRGREVALRDLLDPARPRIGRASGRRSSRRGRRAPASSALRTARGRPASRGGRSAPSAPARPGAARRAPSRRGRSAAPRARRRACRRVAPARGSRQRESAARSAAAAGRGPRPGSPSAPCP